MNTLHHITKLSGSHDQITSSSYPRPLDHHSLANGGGDEGGDEGGGNDGGRVWSGREGMKCELRYTLTAAHSGNANMYSIWFPHNKSFSI